MNPGRREIYLQPVIHVRLFKFRIFFTQSAENIVWLQRAQLDLVFHDRVLGEAGFKVGSFSTKIHQELQKESDPDDGVAAEMYFGQNHSSASFPADDGMEFFHF